MSHFFKLLRFPGKTPPEPVPPAERPIDPEIMDRFGASLAENLIGAAAMMRAADGGGYPSRLASEHLRTKASCLANLGEIHLGVHMLADPATK